MAPFQFPKTIPHQQLSKYTGGEEEINDENIEEEPTTFEDFIARDSKRVCVLLDNSGSKKLKEVSFECDLVLMVGPEGGFSSSELITARSKIGIASLGPRILRAETAPVTALSILQAEFGDLS